MDEFTAIDFETAMYSPNSAVSVGLVRYCDYQPVDRYYSLIRPPRLYIRPDFTDIHGLTVDDVRDAPDFAFLWENEIREFIGTTTLVAHYALFDMRVLCATLDHYGVPFPDIRYFCSCKFARKVWRGFASYSLGNLAKQFGISYDAHNAVADAETCGKIITLGASDLQERYGEMPLCELLDRINVEITSLL